MNFGMIGALGGIGQGLVNQADDLRKEEVANADMGRKKDLEAWLMQAREEFAIKGEARAEARTIAAEGRTDTRTIASEDRAVTRDIAKDDRTWKNEQDRAPVKNQMAVAAASAKADGAVADESRNIDAITTNKGKMTEAGQTQSARDLQNAQADYATANAEFTRGAKSDAADAKANAPSKGDPEARDKLKYLEAEIKDAEKAWRDGLIKGEIIKQPDGTIGTPEQKAAYKEINKLRQRRADLEGAGGTSRPDPLGRAAANGSGKATGPTNKAEAGMMGSVNGGMGADPEALKREIASTEKDLQNNLNPADRANAQAYLNNNKAALSRLEPQTSPAPQAPAAAKAPDVSTPPKKPDLAAALGASTGNAAIDNIVAKNVSAVQAAADKISQAKVLLSGAAKSGDPQALKLYSGMVQQARMELDALLKDMNPQQAAAVRQVVGTQI